MTSNRQMFQIRMVFFLMLTFALSSIEPIWAVPAKPGLITVEQADGSKLSIYIKGDEFFNWKTTQGGDLITMKSDGLYYYADLSSSGKVEATSQRVSIDGRMQSAPSVSKAAASKAASAASIAQSIGSQQRANQSAATKSSSNGFPSEGLIRSAVILVEYSDVKFSVSSPQQAFYNQLNEEGYSVAGATGSAKDYFEINSRGQFEGQFDVYGPYTLNNTRSYYGGNSSTTGNDLRPDQMVWDGVAMADADGVDFSIYDYNNDGYIDNVFVYYAGHNEAEGGSDDSVWPHMWAVSSRPEFDGKMLYIYACTSELRGSSGSTIAGIGTFCHEFSHVFGLADHYDTDGTSNGYSYGLGYYDIMNSGSYNNNGNTPPLHNGLELDMIGWNTPLVLEESESITIDPIQNGEVYKVLTDVDGEYFLIENRNKDSNVWDSYISADGLFITHVDRSTAYMPYWNANAPNAYTSHECFKFVVAGNSSFSTSKEAMVPYPYNGNNEWSSTSAPAALSWSGSELSVNITNIQRNSDGTMTFIASTQQAVVGSVCDQSGAAVSGATLSFTSVSNSAVYTTTSDESGEYLLELPGGSYDVEVTCPFYSDHFESVYISNGANFIDFVLSYSADGVDSISITPEQTQATIVWNPQTYSGFKLEITSGSSAVLTTMVYDCQYVATDLTAGTTYTVTISGYESGTNTEIYSQSFTTVEQLTTIPLISLDYEYNASEVIELKCSNTQSSDTISWQVDGSDLVSSKVTLEAGEHKITAIVTRYKTVYNASRIINVK